MRGRAGIDHTLQHQARAAHSRASVHLQFLAPTPASPPRARRTQADRARVEERGYLHCAAMRFQTPGGLVQVVCRPEDGEEFQADGFAGVFAAWFPPDIGQHAGTWFPEHKLLRSCMLEE